jgi:hypothetical protein
MHRVKQDGFSDTAGAASSRVHSNMRLTGRIQSMKRWSLALAVGAGVGSVVGLAARAPNAHTATRGATASSPQTDPDLGRQTRPLAASRHHHHYAKPRGRWRVTGGQGEGKPPCGRNVPECESGSYRGTTKQVNPDTGQPVTITFAIKADGLVHKITTTTVDQCPNSGDLIVAQHSFAVVSVTRKTSGDHYHFKVHAGPKDQPATLRGTLLRDSTVTGKLTDTSPDPSGQGVCRASTHWRAAP